MRYLTLAVLLSFPLFTVAQTVEVIPPAAIGEDLTATWTVVLTNPGDQPTQPQALSGVFPVLPGSSELASVPAGCSMEGAGSHCLGVVLAPGERRELSFTVRYGSRFGTFFGSAHFGNVFAQRELKQAHEFVVTSVEDDGPGSLRQAITVMNQSCTTDPEPCAVVFRIDGPPPVEGWFTIRPRSPLPPLTAGFFAIDGRTQTLHTGDTNPAGPEIMIDGSSAWGHGLQIDGKDALVSDLAIGNFYGNGIASAPQFGTSIHRCHLGMDPSGTRPAPNGLRGTQIEGGQIEVADSILGGNFRAGGWFDSPSSVTIVRNRFTGNGASGMYAKTTGLLVKVEENVIAGNAHAGISLDRQSWGNFANNDFAGNLGRAIDIGIDGPTLEMAPGLPGRGGGVIGAPAITSVRYENGETIIEAQLAPRTPNTILRDIVYFYAGAEPKDGGEVIASSEGRHPDQNGRYVVRVPLDLRGRWVSAATYAIYIYNWDDPAPGTSEIGLPRLVERACCALRARSTPASMAR